LIPLPAIQHVLSVVWVACRRQLPRTATWLPWLGVAILIAVALAPGTVTASRLAFQSSEEPTPIPPTPTAIPPTPTPIPLPPTPTPIPPALPPTPTSEVPAPAQAPTQAPPTQVVPTQAPAPSGEQPTQPAPSPAVEPTQPPPVPPTQRPSPPAQATRTPNTRSVPEEDLPAKVGADQPVINWVKFWDTLAVTFAYPWLCCGLGLLLLVPLVLLFLEIKGRRPPRRPPERLSIQRRDDQE
jgi:hypothetical protein